MESKRADEDADQKFDMDFRRILRTIKLYIPSIMNMSYLALYRAWLEKLSNVDSSEKEERNRYLSELCSQIQQGILEPPFTQPPFIGPLHSFKAALKIKKDLQREQPCPISSTNQNSKQGEATSTRKYEPKKEKQNQVQIQFDKYLKNPPKNENLTQSTVKMREPLNSPPTVQRPCMSHKKRTQNTIIQEEYSQSPESSKVVIHETEEICISSSKRNQQEHQQNSYHQKPPEKNESIVYYEVTDQDPESLYLPIVEAHRDSQELLRNKPQQYNQDRSNESSWCDLSEISKPLSKFESGDSVRSSEGIAPEEMAHNMPKKVCNNTISDLMEIIAELKRHNLALSAKAEAVVRNLSEEIKLLKGKVQKLGDVRMTAKDKQFTDVAQWQKIVETLRKRLLEATTQNAKLTNENSNLKQELEEFSVEKQKELAVVRQRLSELYNNEIQTLNQNHVRHIVDIENKFTSILTEKEHVFNQKLNDLKEIYDRKISNSTKSRFS